jgi:OOP family OmpA-OmpF porin
MIRAALTLIALLAAPSGHALEVTLPRSAQATVDPFTIYSSYALPMGEFRDGQVPVLTLKGNLRRAAWRINRSGTTPLALAEPVLKQLEDQGYDIVFECGDAACGGFDFRFAIDVLPAPGMFVNLRSFRFASAIRGPLEAPHSAVAVLASSNGSRGHLQIYEIAQSDAPPTVFATVTPPGADEDLPAADLLSAGHLALQDLTFNTGTSDLGPGPFLALQTLADLLRNRPDLRIALVGHTDSVGALEGNIALSKRRAEAVQKRLIDSYGIAADRLEANGVGYLAPLATNSTAAGRTANRRVEAVLLPAPSE